MVRLIQCKREVPLHDESGVKLILQALTWFFGAFFLFLLALDNHANKNNYFIVLLKALVFVLSIIWVVNSVSNRTPNIAKYKSENSVTLSGTLSAFSLANIIYHGIKTDYWYIIACALLIVVLLVPDEKRKPRMITYYFLIAVPAILMELAISSQNSLQNSATMFLLAVIAPCIIALSQKDTSHINALRKGVFIAFCILIGISSLIVCVLFSDLINESLESSSVFELLINVIYVFAISQYVKTTFKSVIDTENYKGTSSEIRRAVLKKQGLMYPIYGLIFAGGLILIIHATFPNISWISKYPYNTGFLFHISIVFFAISLSVLTVLSILKTNCNSKKIIAIIAFCFSYLALISAVLTSENISHIMNKGIKWFYFFNIPSTIGIVVVLSKGFLNNITKLRGFKPNLLENAAAFILSIGILISEVTLTLQLIINHSIASIIIYMVGLLFSTVMLPMLAASIISRPPQDPQLTKNNQIMGVFQDGFLYSISVILSKLFVVFLLPSVIGTEKEIFSILGCIAYLILFIALINWPIEYCVANNNQHYLDRKSEIEEENNETKKIILEDQLRQLKIHLTLQNKWTFIIAAPFSILSVIILTSDFILHDKKSWREMFIPL